MPKTAFRPQIDGFTCAHAWALEPVEREQLRGVFQAAIPEALALLHRPFNGALEVGKVDDVLATWMTRASQCTSGLASGMVFAVLDFYMARRLRRPQRSARHCQTLRPYLWRRMLDNIQANAATLLAWCAVQHAIPPQWLPASCLIAPIQRAIGRMRQFGHTTIEVDLRIRHPGGPPWLRRASLHQWEIVQQHIDAGRPWPLALIDSTADPFAQKQVVAYGYEDPGDGTGILYVYDVDKPGYEHSLALDFRDETLQATGSLQGPHDPSIQGFFCLTYVPTLPPSSFLGRILQAVLSWRPLWHVRRCLRLRGQVG